MNERRVLRAAAAILAAIGIGLRVAGTFTDPLWLDEAYTAYAADHGFAFLWAVVPRYETHPPFYYSLMHLWVLLFGDGRVALRLPGLIAGLATVPMVALAAGDIARLAGWSDMARQRLGFAAFAFACVSIPLNEMTHEVRPYPLMILAYAGAIWMLVRLAIRVRDGGAIAGRSYAAYLALLAAMLWLHNLGPLYGVALTLALAVAVLRQGLTRRDWAWLVGGHLAVALLYLPALRILLDQAPTWVSSTWLRFSLETVLPRLGVLYALPDWPGLAALVLAGLAVAALVRGGGGRIATMLLTLALVPVLLSVSLSLTVAPVFITRTMTPVAVPTLLLFAIGATAWSDRRRWLALGAAAMLGPGMLSSDVQARLDGPMQDWYRTVDWLAARVRPGDRIFAYPNEGALPMAYALRDKGLSVPIRAIPTAVPSFAEAGGWYPTGSRGVVSLPRRRLRAIAQEPATRAVPTIWLLRLGAETYDPGNMFLEELHRGRYIVRSWKSGAIDIVGLARRPTPPPAPVRSPR